MSFAGRDLMCVCGHGPAVHTDGAGICLLAARGSTCGCARWSPVPWVEPAHECERSRQLEAALRSLTVVVQSLLAGGQPPLIPQQRATDSPVTPVIAPGGRP